MQVLSWCQIAEKLLLTDKDSTASCLNDFYSFKFLMLHSFIVRFVFGQSYLVIECVVQKVLVRYVKMVPLSTAK